MPLARSTGRCGVDFRAAANSSRRACIHAVKGTNDWSTYEIPFFLNDRARNTDLIKLNVASEGQARVWVKNLELLYAAYE